MTEKLPVEYRPAQRPLSEDSTVDATVLLALVAHLRRTGSAIFTTDEIMQQTGFDREIVETCLERIAERGGVSRISTDR